MKYKLAQNNPMRSQTFCEFGFPLTALGCGKICSEIIVKKTLAFIRTKLLVELGQKVPVGQNLKLFKSSSKPDQQGLSSSIRFEVMYLRTYRSSQNRKCASLKINDTLPPPPPHRPSSWVLLADFFWLGAPFPGHFFSRG